MALQYSGYNANTAENLLLDAGAFYKNLAKNETTGEWEGTLLGATQGGGEFSAVPNMRQIPVDGIKGKAKGLSVFDSWDVSITANLLEVTADTLKTALAGATIDTVTDTDYDIITAKNDVELTDYFDNISFVGRISGSQKPVIIIVKNALNTEGITLKTEDSKEGILPVKFAGHYDSTDLDTPPFEIYYPKAA